MGSSNVLDPKFSRAHGGPDAWISLRPERIAVLAARTRPGKGEASADAVITGVHYHGAVTRIVAHAGDTRLTATVPTEAVADLKPGDKVRLAWPLDGVTAMEAS